MAYKDIKKKLKEEKARKDYLVTVAEANAKKEAEKKELAIVLKAKLAAPKTKKKKG